LLVTGLALFTVAMILPSTIFASAFADVRLFPFAVALVVLSIALRRSVKERFRQIVAVSAVAFALVRIAFATASLVLYSHSYTAELEALDQVPVGSRIAAFSEHPCTSSWQDHRLRHLANLAIGRRLAFVNGQFVSEGWNALRVTNQAAAPYTGFPSSMVTSGDGCDWPLPTAQERVDEFPRQAFDFVWLLNVPAERRPTVPWLTETWSTENSALYRITRQRSSNPPS